MGSERLFTNADDARLLKLIAAARQRLVVAAPGISDEVASALASRISASDAPAQLAVILDVDPEVCRLGFGTVTGLEKVTLALEARGLRMNTAEGLRVGLVISDDQTLIYSPTPLLIEAGSHAPTKPNAILLRPDASEALATACGLGSAEENPLQREIGDDYLNKARLQAVKQDLAGNPPKKFDLTRIERVFNYELQFVDFKVEGYSLGRRVVSLDPCWLGLSDKELKNRFRNTFRLFESGEGITVEMEELDKDGKPQPGKKRKVSEKTINDQALELRRELIPLGGYGSVMLKRKRADFENRVEEFRAFVGRYAQKVSEHIDEEMADMRERLIEDLAPDLVKNPPKKWRDLSISGTLDEARVRTLLSAGLDQAFAMIKRDFAPKVTLVFKDVTYTTIVGDPDFRKKLVEHFGPDEVAKLFHEHDAAQAVPEHPPAT